MIETPLSEPLFVLTPTAAVIWQELEQWRSADFLAEALVRDYEVTREQAAADVRDFLAQLEEVRAVNHRETAA